MAQAAPQKSHGMKLAEQQLLRHGWKQGKGLGRDEKGISDAIKVKFKFDKSGIGHKESEQFTFHWWDHVFNKASSSLTVENDKDGVVVKKTNEEEEVMISNKKPCKASLNKTMLYGNFVKSATLLSGKEEPVDESSSSDEEQLDLSTASKLSDEDLIKACGGRTAHKGARHGLTMSAKLARLEQQEQEFMAKYAKKKETHQTTSQSDDMPNPTEESLEPVKTKHKKAKRKKQSSDEVLENGIQDDDANAKVVKAPDHEASEKKKKRSKDKLDLDSNTPAAFVDSNKMTETESKKKKKRKRREKISEAEEGVKGSSTTVVDEDSTNNLQDCEKNATATTDSSVTHPLISDSVCKKEKKKKKKCSEKLSALEEGLDENGEASMDITESYVQEHLTEGDVALQTASDTHSKKRKKKKSSKLAEEEELNPEIEDIEPDAGEKKILKSKKRKRCRDEERDDLMDPMEKQKKKHTKKHNS